MKAYSGSLVLLKILNIEENQYETIAGMKATKISINNQSIDCSNKSSGKWRILLDNAGSSSASITGSGVFTNSKSEEIIRQSAFNSEIKNFQLCFGNGNIMQGDFLITNYERIGNHQEEENYSLSLESSGELKFIS